jgi:hypothetical protein
LYVLNHQFADIASVRDLPKVTNRLPQSIDKLAHLAVRYSVRSLLGKDERTALRYFHLAMAINSELSKDPIWKQLQKYWTADLALKVRILEYLRNSDNLAARNISYDPPPGSTPIFSSEEKASRMVISKSPFTNISIGLLSELSRTHP